MNRGVQVDPRKRTLAAYLEGVLKTSAKPRVAENTFRDYEKHLRKQVVPTLGSKRLDQITPGQIRALYVKAAQGHPMETLFTSPSRRGSVLVRLWRFAESTWLSNAAGWSCSVP